MTSSLLPLHGVGGAADLPIPPSLAIAGAVAALTISFTVLALAWRRPRYDPPPPVRPVPGWLDTLVSSAAWTWGWRVIGLAATAYVAWAAVAGPDLALNPVFGTVYVLLWVGLVPASLVFGPVVRALSPWRTIVEAVHLVTGRDPEHGWRRLPDGVGVWPAALGLLAFAWLELVSPDAGTLTAVRWWFGIYAVIMLAGGLVFGGRFLAAADPFEVYSTLVARMSVWSRTDGGRLGIRSPLANLAATTPVPGLVAVVSVLFGTTAFDSFSASSRWLRFSMTSPWAGPWLDSLVLVLLCLLVSALFVIACRRPRPLPGIARQDLPGLMAHSMVPIVIGYVFAHYVSFLVQVGSQTLIQLSDPLVTGADLLGTGDWSVVFWLSDHPTLLATMKVLGVALGHLLGVVAAHDRAMATLPAEEQLPGQLPLLFTMVGFTAGGLYLLFSA